MSGRIFSFGVSCVGGDLAEGVYGISELGDGVLDFVQVAVLQHLVDSRLSGGGEGLPAADEVVGLVAGLFDDGFGELGEDLAGADALAVRVGGPFGRSVVAVGAAFFGALDTVAAVTRVSTSLARSPPFAGSWPIASSCMARPTWAAMASSNWLSSAGLILSAADLPLLPPLPGGSSSRPVSLASSAFRVGRSWSMASSAACLPLATMSLRPAGSARPSLRRSTIWFQGRMWWAVRVSPSSSTPLSSEGWRGGRGCICWPRHCRRR